jgi:hypothetical protein
MLSHGTAALPRRAPAAPLAVPARRPAPRRLRAAPSPRALSAAAGLAAFFAPGAGVLAYAFVKGKGNLSDGLSRLLTEVSRGYFQPNVGGANVPVATGELSDLAGDEPLFKALYKWFIESGGVYKLEFGPKVRALDVHAC